MKGGREVISNRNNIRRIGTNRKANCISSLFSEDKPALIQHSIQPTRHALWSNLKVGVKKFIF